MAPTYYFVVYPLSNPKDRTEILFGVESVMQLAVSFMSNTKERMDIFFDHRAPSLVIGVKEYKNGFINLRRRGGKIRALTDITEDNIRQCKVLINLVDELRHLDGVRGGMAVNESEYMATTVLRRSKPPSKAIYSNFEEFVAQGQYIFDTLWNAAIPAEKKIRAIEEGSIAIEPATIIENNPDEIIKQLKRIDEGSNQLSICLTAGGMQYRHIYLYDVDKKLLDKKKRGKHKGIRYITKIDRGNIDLVKQYLKLGAQIRHTRNLPSMSFGFSDKESAATIDKMEHGKRIQNLLVSNESAYLKHFGSMFDELWNNGVDASDRIRDVEEGKDLAEIEIIANPREGIARAWSAIERAKEEVLVMLSSANAFRRQIQMGALELLRQTSGQKRNVKVSLLIPHEEDQSFLSTMIEQSKRICPRVDFRSMDRSFRTRITVVIVDRKECIITELKDDSKDFSYYAAGLSTYSNSKSIVSSYVSIFQSIWRQTDLYEQLKVHDKMQKEFINMAAHELRTPIQPILGLSESLLSRKGKIEEYYNILAAISRNAKRLLRLSENVLDVTRIENGSLPLVKHHIRLKDLVLGIVEDYRSEEYGRIDKTKINFHYVKDHDRSQIMVDADLERLTQVIYNLLSNAAKFLDKEGKIDVRIKKLKKSKQAIISVSNTGKEIDPEIYPRLFTKFTTSSFVGTGLGLYVSKNIVEAHGGRIWAKNKPNGKGATFSISLPLATK